MEKIVPEPNSGCWLWTGRTAHFGYGQVRWDGRNMAASRAMYIAIHGPLGSRDFVLHKCDNPPCCNPEHLELGDHRLNMKQMRERGRAVGMFRALDPALRDEIKELRSGGLTHREIAAVCNVSAMTAHKYGR